MFDLRSFGTKWMYRLECGKECVATSVYWAKARRAYRPKENGCWEQLRYPRVRRSGDA